MESFDERTERQHCETSCPGVLDQSEPSDGDDLRWRRARSSPAVQITGEMDDDRLAQRIVAIAQLAEGLDRGTLELAVKIVPANARHAGNRRRRWPTRPASRQARSARSSWADRVRRGRRCARSSPRGGCLWRNWPPRSNAGSGPRLARALPLWWMRAGSKGFYTAGLVRFVDDDVREWWRTARFLRELHES